MDKNNIYHRTKKSYSLLFEEYIKKHSSNKSASSRLDDFLSNLKSNSLILDAGCGHGRDMKIMKSLGYNVIGVDYSDEMIDFVTKQEGLDAYVMDILDLKFQNEYFDAIWSSAVLHHLVIEDIKKVIMKFFDILKPTGRLFVSIRINNIENWDNEYKKNPRYYSGISEDHIINILSECQFIIDQVIYENKNDKNWIFIYSHKSKISDKQHDSY